MTWILKKVFPFNDLRPGASIDIMNSSSKRNSTYHVGNSPDSDGPKNLGNFLHLHGNFWQFWFISRIPVKHPGLFVGVVGIQVDILDKC